MRVVGYQSHEIKELFENIKPILRFSESTEKQVRKARDLSSKREIPKGDALHALIARDSKATLVTLDNHVKNKHDVTTSSLFLSTPEFHWSTDQWNICGLNVAVPSNRNIY